MKNSKRALKSAFYFFAKYVYLIVWFRQLSNERNDEIHRGKWWIKSNKLANCEMQRGESKNGGITLGCRKRLRVRKDHYNK